MKKIQHYYIAYYLLSPFIFIENSLAQNKILFDNDYMKNCGDRSSAEKITTNDCHLRQDAALFIYDALYNLITDDRTRLARWLSGPRNSCFLATLS